MEAFDCYLNDLVNLHKKQYSAYTGLKWMNFREAGRSQSKRDRLTEPMTGNWLFKNTKPWYHKISEGCNICGQGNWSCLFITGKCNAGCFYCPAPQHTDELPATQNLEFGTPEAYAEYVRFFGFKGVSFSGGEPLLFFNRTLEYLKQVRKSCDPGIYVWMYTNGILGDREKFNQLANAGLNEVRFDIGATGFKTSKIREAKGLIPVITVEIPAIPEEKNRLIRLLPELIEMGVTHLNLHQLRLTPHNAPRLALRNYTYIPAEQPVVMESELAALEIINHASQNQLDIGINYCSFFFKNRFQKAGFRRITAQKLADQGDVLTEKGFIREKEAYSIGYKTITISGKPVPDCRELKLRDTTLYIKKETAMKKTVIPEAQQAELYQLLLEEPDSIPGDEFLFRVWQKEYIESGLRNY